jgi:NAD dependent epimerase/dehydratase
LEGFVNWKNKKVLVTGAAGFIGSHLTEALLRKGAKVTALTRYNSRNHWGNLEHLSKSTPRNLSVVSGDIRDPFYVQSIVKGQDVVLHLAALIAIPFSYHAPQSFVDTNVQGTLNVLEACRHEKTGRLVVTSTSEVYGTAQYVPIDEKHPLQGQSPYSATKIGADHLAESYFRSFNLPVCILRPFNTYGPRQSARAVIPTVIASLLSHQSPIKLGDLKPIRDFTYVDDTVNGFILAAESSLSGRAVNIGTGKGVTVRTILETCCDILNIKVPSVASDKARLRPKNSEVWKLVCQAALAHKHFHWRPQVDLRDGLEKTIHHIRQNMGSYKAHIYNV